MGAKGAHHGPPQLPALAPARELENEPMPPLWQYLSRVERHSSPFAHPKAWAPGHASWQYFSRVEEQRTHAPLRQYLFPVVKRMPESRLANYASGPTESAKGDRP
jgi:hypothetical protein